MDGSAPARVALFLEQVGLEAERRGPREWGVRIPTAMRGAIGVGIEAGERTVTMRAFFLRGPDRGHEEVYRRLLRRHLDTRHWRFALDDVGDLYLVADVPLAGLDPDGLDGLLGALSALVDETYEGVVRAGFDVPEGALLGPPPP